MKNVINWISGLFIIMLIGFIPDMIGTNMGKCFVKWISANPDKIPNVIIGGFVFIIVSCILGKITKKIGNKHKKNNVEHKAD